MVKPALKAEATPPGQLIALQSFNALQDIFSGYNGKYQMALVLIQIISSNELTTFEEIPTNRSWMTKLRVYPAQ